MIPVESVKHKSFSWFDTRTFLLNMVYNVFHEFQVTMLNTSIPLTLVGETWFLCCFPENVYNAPTNITKVLSFSNTKKVTVVFDRIQCSSQFIW